MSSTRYFPDGASGPRSSLAASLPGSICRGDPTGRGRIRTRPGSITLKCPGQSDRLVSTSVMRVPTSVGFGMATRNNTTPQWAGSPNRHASSPKSLSNVTKTRASATARSRITRSVLPGASVLTQATSCPAARNAVTAAPGRFSSAGNLIIRQSRRDTPFRTGGSRSRTGGRLRCPHA